MLAVKVAISVKDVTPTADAILASQQVPSATADSRTIGLAQDAIAAYRRLAAPSALVGQIYPDEFRSVFAGAGQNAAVTALDPILESAERFALFVCTVGPAISGEIARLFELNDFAAGTMLDAAASLGADMAADRLEKLCAADWRSTGVMDRASEVMRFSPGYCGWHVSGQKKLFAVLRPERIGITLNESYLMQPLKSVSGVIVAAPWRTFEINDSFPFCTDCQTHSCRDRFDRLRMKHTT